MRAAALRCRSAAPTTAGTDGHAQRAQQTATFQSAARTVRFATPPRRKPRTDKAAADQPHIPQQSVSERPSAPPRSCSPRMLTDVNDGVRLGRIVSQYPQGEAKQQQLHLRVSSKPCAAASGAPSGWSPKNPKKKRGEKRRRAAALGPELQETGAVSPTNAGRSGPPEAEEESGGGRGAEAVLEQRGAAAASLTSPRSCASNAQRAAATAEEGHPQLHTHAHAPLAALGHVTAETSRLGCCPDKPGRNDFD